MFSWKGISFLSSVVGIPQRLHPDTEACKTFDEARVFVEADLTKELPESFRFRMPSGKDICIEYSYPWLPPRCNHCSKWGHISSKCRRKDLIAHPPSEKATRPEGEVPPSSSPLKPQPSTGSLTPGFLNRPSAELHTSTNLQSPEASIPSDLELGWKQISPTSKKTSAVSPEKEPAIIISPSRYSILEDESHTADQRLLILDDTTLEKSKERSLQDIINQDNGESSTNISTQASNKELKPSRTLSKITSTKLPTAVSNVSLSGTTSKRKARRKN